MLHEAREARGPYERVRELSVVSGICDGAVVGSAKTLTEQHFSSFRGFPEFPTALFGDEPASIATRNDPGTLQAVMMGQWRTSLGVTLSNIRYA